jgi:DNA-binding MarR family transcriptional regulator
MSPHPNAGPRSDSVEPADSADLETRITAIDHQSLRTWLRLLACTNLIEARVRQSLFARFDTTLPRFDLMAQLERVPQGLRMGELSRRMMVTGGNVTGITDQLEKDGLVVRDIDPRDRRSFRVRLTEQGKHQFARMAVEHERWIVDMFSGLTDREKRDLERLVGRLKKSVTGGMQ